MFERTRLCGCGECRFDATATTCPQEGSKDAIWLWASVKAPVVEEDETEEDDEVEDLYDILGLGREDEDEDEEEQPSETIE